MSDVLRFREIGPARPIFSLRKRKRRVRAMFSVVSLLTVSLVAYAIFASRHDALAIEPQSSACQDRLQDNCLIAAQLMQVNEQRR